MKQQTLAAGRGFEKHERATRKAAFLGRMEGLIPWAEFCALIEPHYPKPGNNERMKERMKGARLDFPQPPPEPFGPHRYVNPAAASPSVCRVLFDKSSRAHLPFCRCPSFFERPLCGRSSKVRFWPIVTRCQMTGQCRKFLVISCGEVC